MFKFTRFGYLNGFIMKCIHLLNALKKLSFSIIYVIIIIYKYFESACIFIFYILIF